MKKCSLCRHVKPMLDFNSKQNYCRPCQKTKRHAYYEANKEKERAQYAAFYAANKEKRAADFATWAETNRETLLEKKRHRYASIAVEIAPANRTRVKAWVRANPGARAAQRARRDAAELRATPVWADQDAITSLYRLAAIMSRFIGTTLHVDHRVPLRGKTVCGLHCEANLQIIPASANAIKGARYWPDMPDAYLKAGGNVA